jgi:hypothetical protein
VCQCNTSNVREIKQCVCLQYAGARSTHLAKSHISANSRQRRIRLYGIARNATDCVTLHVIEPPLRTCWMWLPISRFPLACFCTKSHADLRQAPEKRFPFNPSWVGLTSQGVKALMTQLADQLAAGGYLGTGYPSDVSSTFLYHVAMGTSWRPMVFIWSSRGLAVLLGFGNVKLGRHAFECLTCGVSDMHVRLCDLKWVGEHTVHMFQPPS